MKRHWFYPAVLFLLFVLVFPAALVRASPAAGKVEPALLERFAAAGRSDLIVRFAEQADLSPALGMNWHDRGWFVYETLMATADRSQGAAIDAVKGRRLDYRTFIAGNELYVYAGDLALANALATLPGVAAVAAPRTYYLDPALQQAVPLQPEALTWGVIDVKADQFWSTFGLQGAGILVASIDTGVAYEHPALDQAYKCAANPADPACWLDPSGECTTPCDPTPHGTPTLGPILADDDPSLPYQAGVAPDAQWIACRGCGLYSCSDESLNACADWVLAPGGSPDNRPHIVYNGWGGQGCDDWFQGKSQAWFAAGIFATFSPGGSGSGCNTLGSPSDYQESFTGTAHDSNRYVGSFASRGPSCYGHDPYTKPNISAPGVTMCVPIPPDGWTCGYSGTSFSSAYPAGAVALLWSCAPGLVGQVYPTFEALQDHADAPPAGNCGAPPDGEGNYTYGYGYLNVLAAGLAYCGPAEEGVLDGHVYDAGTGDPLAGATVTAQPGTVQSTTDPEGYYSMTLDVGTYTVTAAMPAYLPETVSGVAITTGVTTTQDFSLTAEPPAASFDSNSPVCLGSAMAFIDTSSGAPTAWLWDFGDGVGSSIEQNPTYTYTAAADFVVTLVVTNPQGSDDVTGTVTVEPLPAASFDHEPPAGPLPLTVYFTNTSIYAISPTWDLGDGTVAAGDRVSHTYTLSGTYNVTLTVESPYGCGPDSAVGTVVAECVPVDILSVTAAISGCVVTFGADLSGTPPFVYLWDLGAFGASTATNPVVNFQATGAYPVVLYVTNCSGGGGMAYPLEVQVACGVTYAMYLPLLFRGYGP